MKHFIPLWRRLKINHEKPLRKIYRKTAFRSQKVIAIYGKNSTQGGFVYVCALPSVITVLVLCTVMRISEHSNRAGGTVSTGEFWINTHTHTHVSKSVYKQLTQRKSSSFYHPRPPSSFGWKKWFIFWIETCKLIDRFHRNSSWWLTRVGE